MLVVTRVSRVAASSKYVAAERDLATLRAAFLDETTGYLRDMRGIPGFSLGYLRVANLLIATNLYGAVGVRSFRVDDPQTWSAGCGWARAEVFQRWDDASERGWRGPYLGHFTGTFPAAGAVRFAGDASFAARGFYPPVAALRLPDDIRMGLAGCSVYGFPGEPALLDPWGNPYVLQIPPPQAFAAGSVTNVADEIRFQYARVVSAGPDGCLQTPCFGYNATNHWASSWDVEGRRLSRQAGRTDGGDVAARGDDLVLFLSREDSDEGVAE